MSKIQGVPEGWKVKRIGSAKDDDYIPWFNYEQDKIVATKYSDVFDLVHRPACCIIEREVKIIDMSKCKVDIEIQSTLYKDDWRIDSCDSLQRCKFILSRNDPDFLDGKNYRVRQNHYFKITSFEKIVPDGLCLYVERLIDGLPIWSHEESHAINWNDETSDILGFVVEGNAQGYAYKHEIEGGEV